MGNNKTLELLKEVDKKFKSKKSKFQPYQTPAIFLELEEYFNDAPKTIIKYDVFHLTGCSSSDIKRED